MARPRTYKTEGVVLRQTPLGEADRILTLYTQDMGKLRAVARGVRRTTSKLGGHLDQLMHAALSLSVGRNLDTVLEAQAIHSFRGLREDLDKLSQAVYLAELVDGFSVEQSPNTALYNLLLSTLNALEAGRPPAPLMRYFELHLLRHSGFGPELHRCIECRSALEPADHLYSCAGGGVLCQDCRVTSREALLPLSLNAMKVLRFFEREPFDRALSLGVSNELLGQAERLLGTYIRHVLERQLNSTEFMKLVASAGAKGARAGRTG